MTAQFHLMNHRLWSRRTLCYFSPLVFIYLFSKNNPAVSPWGDANGECLFVVTDQRRPSCVMCGWGWLGAAWWRCCLSFECVLSHRMPPSKLPLPFARSHVLATRGWVSGQLLQQWQWVQLQTSSNKYRKNHLSHWISWKHIPHPQIIL